MKKPIEYWQQEEREQKINVIKGKMVMLGIPNEYPDQMQKAFKIMDEFVETGENQDVKIKLIGAERIFVLTLRGNKRFEPSAVLLYRKGI